MEAFTNREIIENTATMNGIGYQGYHSGYQGNPSCHAECIFKIRSDLMDPGRVYPSLMNIY